VVIGGKRRDALFGAIVRNVPGRGWCKRVDQLTILNPEEIRTMAREGRFVRGADLPPQSQSSTRRR
jgi:hypothetical protein